MKGKLHRMPERGTHLTLKGENIGPTVSRRDAQVISRWLNGAWKAIVSTVRRAELRLMPGWQCKCACHRLRQATVHCVGCDPGKKRGG